MEDTMAYDPDYNPTSKEAAVALCRELGIDPEKFWGVVNDFACDAFYAGQVDEKKAQKKAD
jgi:hypothetical protein